MLKCCLGIDYGRYFCWKRDDFVKEEAISFERNATCSHATNAFPGDCRLRSFFVVIRSFCTYRTSAYNIYFSYRMNRPFVEVLSETAS